MKTLIQRLTRLERETRARHRRAILTRLRDAEGLDLNVEEELEALASLDDEAFGRKIETIRLRYRRRAGHRPTPTLDASGGPQLRPDEAPAFRRFADDAAARGEPWARDPVESVIRYKHEGRPVR